MPTPEEILAEQAQINKDAVERGERPTSFPSPDLIDVPADQEEK